MLGEGAGVELDSRRDGRPPVIDLDDEYFKRLADFDERFARGPAVAGGIASGWRSRATWRSGVTSWCAGR